MRPALFATAALLLNTVLAAAQGGEGVPPGARPATGMGSKTMTSCRADLQKYCPAASRAIQKECLVRNWDHISNDCQDAIGTPGRGRAGAAR